MIAHNLTKQLVGNSNVQALDKATIAVFPFIPAEGVTADTVVTLQDKLITALDILDKCTIVDRVPVDKALSELRFQFNKVAYTVTPAMNDRVEAFSTKVVSVMQEHKETPEQISENTAQFRSQFASYIDSAQKAVTTIEKAYPNTEITLDMLEKCRKTRFLIRSHQRWDRIPILPREPR